MPDVSRGSLPIPAIMIVQGWLLLGNSGADASIAPVIVQDQRIGILCGNMCDEGKTLHRALARPIVFTCDAKSPPKFRGALCIGIRYESMLRGKLLPCIHGAVLHAVTFFSGLAIVEAVKGANKVACDAADTFEFDICANENLVGACCSHFGFAVNHRTTLLIILYLLSYHGIHSAHQWSGCH